MPDLRRDPIVGRWVIITTERSGRPHDFIPVQAARPLAAALCPFCPGQERLTPKEIMAYRLQPMPSSVRCAPASGRGSPSALVHDINPQGGA